jgi:radical SAM protein with 4Fe4S-binding SPASM domain
MQLTRPLYVQQELTYKCPMRCGTCLNEPRHSCSSSEPLVLKREPIETPKFREIANVMSKKGKVFAATMTGGEPLSVKNRLFAALEAYKENGVYCDMNSTLSILTEKVAERIVSLGLQGVLTSVYSHKESVHDAQMDVEGALEATIRGIQIMKEVAPQVIVSANMVVAQNNYQDVFALGERLIEIGADALTVTPSTPTRTGKNNQMQYVPSDQMMLEALYALARVEDDLGLQTRLLQGLPHCFLHPHPLLRRYTAAGCDAGKSYITLNPWGDVKPCAQIGDKFGNVLEEDFQVIWDRMQEYRDGSYTPEPCKPCDFTDLCGGGCRAEAERLTGGDLATAHPYRRKALKMVTDDAPVKLNGEVGTTFTVYPFRWRQESEDMFIVQGSGGQYATLGKTGMALLKVFRDRGSVRVTQEMADNQDLARLVKLTTQNGILEAVQNG